MTRSGTAAGPRAPGEPFTVMVKPVGPQCNLDCSYCYYTEKQLLFPSGSLRMKDDLLATFIRQYMEGHEGREITFMWQGGEPTLLGIAFFERVLELQRQYLPAGKVVRNALQTNGTLLDRRWARFLREHDFLVGLSIDGPRRLHDRYRVTKKGLPTFDVVLGALRLLRDEGVDFNTLTVVHRDNAAHGKEIYRFLRGEGVRFMQFIPLVERLGPGGGLAGPPGQDPVAAVTRWSVLPGGFGTFLCDVFDSWVRRDVGSVFVQLFEVHLALWAGLPSSLCVFAQTCGRCLVMEHNGDVFACDHYVYPDYRLGNLRERSLRDLAGDEAQRRFGRDKRDGLPPACRSCAYLPVCGGGCPKHRFARTPEGAAGLNYLCPSYRRYFGHVGPTLRRMAGALRGSDAGRPAPAG